MRLATLLGPDLKEALEADPDALREAFEEFHPEDIAQLMDELPLEDAVAILRTLPDEVGAGVLERVSNERQLELLSQLGSRDAAPFVVEMSADDRVDLVQDLPEALATELLDELVKVEPEVAQETRELVEFGEETAGGRMTTEYVALPPDTKIWRAIEEVRQASRENEVEIVYYVYVVAYGDQLVGVASLRDLILAEPSQTLEDIMTEQVVRVAPTDDQEKVADIIARYDLSAVPVVSDRGTMMGVVTVDDMVDVLTQEATEDAQKAGAVVPLADSYFNTPLHEFVWKRGIWLVILFMGQLLTASVMESNEHAIETIAGLAIFIPLIISSGGNAGSQSASLVIRALAVGEVFPRDWWKVLFREIGIALSIGLLLGGLGFGRAILFGEPVWLSISVGASTMAVVLVGALIGALLPLGIRRVGLDPAVSSSPFIASLSDVLGLLIYFAIATSIFYALVG
jgi:magnesium transporter